MEDFNSKYTGEQVEAILDSVANGEAGGGGGGITVESDPIFSASPAASITEEKKAEWDSKMNNVTLATVATTGSYNDLSNKPTIPSAVTESTVSGWGFTKNTGTYSKPSGGIPKTDLASTVQTSLGKADTALQSHQDISGKQDILVSGTNIKTINGESILGSGNIRISGGGGGETAPSESGLWLTEVIDNLETEVITPGSFVRYIYLNPLESLRFMSENMEYDNYNEYCVVFVSGENMSLTLPSYYSWANGVIPEIEPNTYYEMHAVLTAQYTYAAVLTPFKPVE